MNTGLKEIKVFLSCPEDIVKHSIKDVVERILEEDNIYFKSHYGFIFELKHWKKNVYLGKCTPRVQDRINEILKNCDIYLGILWTRFGSPSGSSPEGVSYSSGTEEEFYFAKSLDKKLWFLFCRYPIDPHRIDPEQLNKIKEFKEQLKREQFWYAEFSDEDKLRKVLKENISNFIEEKYSIKIEEREGKLQNLPSGADFSKYSRGF